MIALVVGLAVGGLGVYAVLREQVERSDRRAAIAEERLYCAWKDGYQIPEAPVPDAPPPLVPVLDSVVEEWLSQFDEAGERAYRAKAERLLAEDPDMIGPEIIRRLERARRAGAFDAELEPV